MSGGQHTPGFLVDAVGMTPVKAAGVQGDEHGRVTRHGAGRPRPETPMLFDIATLKDDTSAAAVTQAILARDPSAQITVQLANRRVRVEGLITEHQVLDALQGAGHFASKAPPHSGEGSTCCGGCGG